MTSYRPTGAELGTAIRRLIHRSAGVPAQDRRAARDQALVARVHTRYPEVADLGRSPVLALLRRPGPGTCSWCCAEVLAVAYGEPAPDPASPVLQGLLGHQCRRHQARVDAARTQLAAAARTDLLRWYKARPPAPTGLLWTGREPPAVTAALAAATRRRISTPSYYRRVVEPGDPAPPRRRTMRPRGRPS
jgi:hypothetical protein